MKSYITHVKSCQDSAFERRQIKLVQRKDYYYSGECA
jgi:hypothetical protein